MSERDTHHAVRGSPLRCRNAVTATPARVWDVGSGSELCRFEPADPRSAGSLVLAVAFSADDRWLMTAETDNVARIWDSQRGSPLFEVRHHSDDRWILAAALSLRA